MNHLATFMTLATLLAPAPGCAGAAQEQRGEGPPKLLHSPELNEIMKNEVNQPFSALMFLIFHAGETSPDGEPDYAKIETPASTLRAGITKVRAIVNPPVQTEEAKEVFLTYVDSMVRDSESLYQAVAVRDRPRMETLLKKITTTCNDCHHFFRLKVVGEGPPPPSVVMVEPALEY